MAAVRKRVKELTQGCHCKRGCKTVRCSCKKKEKHVLKGVNVLTVVTFRMRDKTKTTISMKYPLRKIYQKMKNYFMKLKKPCKCVWREILQ